jgi:hypothetical protein
MKGSAMNNSLAHSLEGYVTAIFTDIRPTYGSNHEFERDLNRSLHELAFRGERFLTIDLPALRKHLEKCLEEGLYAPSSLYLSAMVSKRVQVPAFCRDLYLQIFDSQGKLLTSPAVNAIADLRQLFEGFGKLKSPCKQRVIDDEVKTFLTIEESLRRPTLSWSADSLFDKVSAVSVLHFHDGLNGPHKGEQYALPGLVASIDAITRADANTLERVSGIISSTFGDLHLERDDELVSERPQHGTGRVSNLKRKESKFNFSSWPEKLDRIFPYDLYAVNDLGYSALSSDSSSSLDYRNREHPSKLIAVPKTMSGPRLIGSEPNYHMWIQQLIRSQIEARIKDTPLKHCISFGNQEPNRALALSSSRDGFYTTVDLKSASDRLSCWAIERLFRSNVSILERLHASRTRTMRNAINDHWGVLELRKCFTQGSACTFPVQTVAYAMIAITSVIISNGWSPDSKHIARASRLVRVFGDDIIVPVYSLPKLRDLLSFLQLSVNSNKTFSKGKFRESCGLDAYDGVDVTPARVKRFSCNPSHEISQSMLESSNNFFRRGLWNVASWLQSFLRNYQFPIVKINDSRGYSSYCGESAAHLRSRWNPLLHRQEHRITFLASSSKKELTESAYDLLEFLSSSRDQKKTYLSHLKPLSSGSLGIVNKESSVMRTGWKDLSFQR